MIFTPVRKWQRMRRLLPPDWAPGITMIKPAQMKGGLCIQSSFPSLHPDSSGFPRDGTGEGVLVAQSLHPAAAWAPFAAAFFPPPHPFLSINCAAKRHFRKGVWWDRSGRKAWKLPGSFGIRSFQILPFPKEKTWRGRWMRSGCEGYCQFLGISCQEPPQPSASQFSSFWKLFSHVQTL